MRVWTLRKVWEDLSLEVTASGLGGDYEDGNSKYFGKKTMRKIFSTRSKRIEI